MLDSGAATAERGVRAEHDARAAAPAVEISWPDLVRAVRHVVRRLVGPTSDVDDLTQSALEQVVRAMPRFQGRSELSTFVYRISAHVVMNHWRWSRRFWQRFAAEAPEQAARDEREPSELVSARARAARLHRLLDRMDAKKRVVLVLVDIDEVPPSRVAEILECPEATVRSRLRLARNALAALVRDDPFFREECLS